MTKAEIEKRLKERLSPDLYRHSVSTQNMAEELAGIYNIDREKASLAGLLHDCARGMSNKELRLYASRYNMLMDEIQLNQPVLLHAPVAAKIAQAEFGVEDNEILHAIEVHCTGSSPMSTLDKVLYVSDSSEPDRDYPGVQRIRELAYSGDLDGALLEAMDLKIIYVTERKLILHPMSVEARNEVLQERRQALEGLSKGRYVIGT